MLDSVVKIVPMKDYVKPETPTVLQTVTQETDDLEDAITKQKQFIATHKHVDSHYSFVYYQ